VTRPRGAGAGTGGGGERALVGAGSGRKELQQLDEFGVGLSDRVALPVVTVRVRDPDGVAPVDLDVLDQRVVDERLQPTEPEERRHDGRGDCHLGLDRPWIES